MRIASLKASWIPANRFPSVDWAATPAMMPMTPAEARTLAPAACNGGNVKRIAPSPTTTAATMTSRRTMRTCVRMRRTVRLSGTSVRYRARPRSARKTPRAAANQTPDAIARMRNV